jgi:hypothetical protein
MRLIKVPVIWKIGFMNKIVFQNLKTLVSLIDRTVAA